MFGGLIGLGIGAILGGSLGVIFGKTIQTITKTNDVTKIVGNLPSTLPSALNNGINLVGTNTTGYVNGVVSPNSKTPKTPTLNFTITNQKYTDALTSNDYDYQIGWYFNGTLLSSQGLKKLNANDSISTMLMLNYNSTAINGNYNVALWIKNKSNPYDETILTSNTISINYSDNYNTLFNNNNTISSSSNDVSNSDNSTITLTNNFAWKDNSLTNSTITYTWYSTTYYASSEALQSAMSQSGFKLINNPNFTKLQSSYSNTYSFNANSINSNTLFICAVSVSYINAITSQTYNLTLSNPYSNIVTISYQPISINPQKPQNNYLPQITNASSTIYYYNPSSVMNNVDDNNLNQTITFSNPLGYEVKGVVRNNIMGIVFPVGSVTFTPNSTNTAMTIDFNTSKFGYYNWGRLNGAMAIFQFDFYYNGTLIERLNQNVTFKELDLTPIITNIANDTDSTPTIIYNNIYHTLSNNFSLVSQVNDLYLLDASVKAISWNYPITDNSVTTSYFNATDLINTLKSLDTIPNSIGFNVYYEILLNDKTFWVESESYSINLQVSTSIALSLTMAKNQSPDNVFVLNGNDPASNTGFKTLTNNGYVLKPITIDINGLSEIEKLTNLSITASDINYVATDGDEINFALLSQYFSPTINDDTLTLSITNPTTLLNLFNDINAYYFIKFYVNLKFNYKNQTYSFESPTLTLYDLIIKASTNFETKVNEVPVFNKITEEGFSSTAQYNGGSLPLIITIYNPFFTINGSDAIFFYVSNDYSAQFPEVLNNFYSNMPVDELLDNTSNRFTIPPESNKLNLINGDDEVGINQIIKFNVYYTNWNNWDETIYFTGLIWFRVEINGWMYNLKTYINYNNFKPFFWSNGLPQYIS